jgi:alpha-glucosidase
MNIIILIKRMLLVIIGIFMMCYHPVQAAWQSLGEVESYRALEDQSILLHCGMAQVRLDIVAHDCVRVRLAPDGLFEDEFSWAVVNGSRPSVHWELHTSDSLLVAATAQLRVKIHFYPCRIEFCTQDGDLINSDDGGKGMGWDGEQVRCWKQLPPEEHYYGFGEKTGPFDKRGTSMEMWNSDIPGYRAYADPIYVSIPFFVGLKNGRAYGIYFDNVHRTTFDMGVESRSYYSFGADGGELDYYFLYGPHPKKVIRGYSELVGRLPLPPRWSLGYQQCRWSYFPESRVREIAETFRQRRIPCDVIYLDIDYMDDFRCFTWDRDRFPNPQRMLDDLSAQGFQTVVIIDPGIREDAGYWVYEEGLKGDHFCRLSSGELYVGRVWPGASVFPDFTRSETRAWWGSLHEEMMALGIKGFWNDMNEPASWSGPGGTFPPEVIHDNEGRPVTHPACHNVYGMQMARATYEGCRRLRPDRRPFVLTRAGFAGLQRYTALWTGDNTASWDDLRMSLPMMQNIGVSGQPFVGADIGGFGGTPSAELFTRWLQVGIFYGLCRTHTVTGSADQEPWSFGEEHEELNRQAIEVRYRLLPYVYSTFYEASQTGLPVMRPKWLEFPEEQRVYHHDAEFMFGEHLLVAPVLWPGITERQLYLPQGDWYDFWTGKQYPGGTDIFVPVDLSTIPLFARAGAIIPMQEVVQYTDERPLDPLVLAIFPCERSTYTFYEDDGISFEYADGQYALVTYTCEKKDEEVIFHVGERRGDYRPEERSYLLQIHNVDEEPVTVERNGNRLDCSSSYDQLSGRESGWSFDGGARTVWVKFPDTGASERIEVR